MRGREVRGGRGAAGGGQVSWSNLLQVDGGGGGTRRIQNGILLVKVNRMLVVCSPCTPAIKQLGAVSKPSSRD